MNLLRIVYEYPPPWDGLTPGPFELSRAQKKLGHDITILGGGWPIQETYNPSGFKVIRLPFSPRSWTIFFTTCLFILPLYWYLRRFKKIDLVHCHGHLGFFYYFYKRFFGFSDEIPFVLQLHNTAAGREKKAVQSGKAIPFIYKYFEWPLAKLSDKIGCQVADAIICVSDSQRQEVIDFYKIDPKKIYVVENGVNIKMFNRGHKKGQTLIKKGLTPKKNILYVGGISPRKNLDLLIEAINKLPTEYRLLIVGRGDKGYEERLRSLGKEFGVEERVFWTGYVDYPDLPEYYQRADVFVLPSSYEAFPKVLLEALSCGLPVIACGFETKSEIGKYIIKLEKLDAEELAGKIKEVIENPPKIDLEEIKKKFSWLVAARRLDGVYASIGVRPFLTKA